MKAVICETPHNPNEASDAMEEQFFLFRNGKTMKKRISFSFGEHKSAIITSDAEKSVRKGGKNEKYFATFNDIGKWIDLQRSRIKKNQHYNELVIKKYPFAVHTPITVFIVYLL